MSQNVCAEISCNNVHSNGLLGDHLKPASTIKQEAKKCNDCVNCCSGPTSRPVSPQPSLDVPDVCQTSSAPDGGWGWVVVFASFMINLIADGVSFSFGILFIDLNNHFGESKGKTAWVGSLFLSIPLLTGPIASALTDRYGCRAVSIVGAILAASGFIASCFAHSLEFLFLTFSIAGFGLALCCVASVVIVAFYFEKKRALATGLSVCGTGIGTFIFAPLTIILLENYAWRGTILLLAGFFLNIIVFSALMRDIDYPNSISSGHHSDDSGSKKNISENSDDKELNLEKPLEQRLCNSLVLLPTYIQNENTPIEVITELSNREGGYLNMLLEKFPQFLNSAGDSEDSHSYTIQSLPPAGVKSSKFSALKSSKKSDRHIKIPVDSEEVEYVPKHEPHAKQTYVSCAATKCHNVASAGIDTGHLHNLRLQRGSLTYRGAMLNIKRYRLRASSCPDIYRNSMVTIRHGNKMCQLFWDLKDLLMDLIDLSVFHNLRFTFFCISNFLLYAFVDVPYVYFPDSAIDNGVDKESASFLISIIGILNTLGMVFVGFISDKPRIDAAILYSVFVAISGIVTGIIPWIKDYFGMSIIAGIYGFMISANYTLVPIVVVNLISLDCFTNAYGLLLLIQGVANLVGPPLAGWLYDISGNYDTTFYSTGICIFLSGALVVPVSSSVYCGQSWSSVSSSILSNSDGALPETLVRKSQLADKIEMAQRDILVNGQQPSLAADQDVEMKEKDPQVVIIDTSNSCNARKLSLRSRSLVDIKQ